MERIFKVGMKVWDDVHFKGQTGKVYEINEDSNMPIRALFGNQKESYTLFGSCFKGAKPTLSVVPYDFKLPEQIVRHEFKKYDPVLVRDSEALDWNIEVFSHLSRNANMPYMTMRGSEWRFCIPFDAEVYEN